MTRALLTLAVVFAVAGQVAAQAPGRPPRDVLPVREARGTGSISGRVTAADTGVAIRHAIVEADSQLGPREVMTDDDGRFELRDLENASWQLSVTRPGYIPRKYGQSRPFGRAMTIDLRAGQEVAVDISLTRAAAIAGRVYDEYGEPVTAARVSVLRPRMVRNRRYLEPVGEGDMTDDTGAFRLHSLPAGEYYVTASARVAPADSIVQTTFSPTYYPGTADFAGAQKVHVTPGADVFIDFPMLPVRNARVSGFVLSSEGRAARAFVNLTSDASELGTPLGFGGLTRDDDGAFAIANVPPGNYTLVAEVRSGAGPAVEVGSVNVTVDGNDVSAITVPLAKPGSLRGTIVADAGVRRRLPEMLDIIARPRRPGAEVTFTTSSGASFEMPAPPGPFTLEVNVPDGWAVKSVTLGAFDASDLAVDIANEQNVPATVVLTDRVTEVSGTVAGGADSAVVIFPADPVDWTPRRVRSIRTDARGRFRFLGLPPGDRYLAVAVSDLDEGQEGDPEFLRQVQDGAFPFSLGPDEKRTLELKVIP
jgi:carboxypeptidase family protein